MSQNSSGQCGYGDNLCWFLHCESADESLAAANIKCNFCEKEFQFRSQLLRHKKQKHWDSVSICRNEEQNNCKFGSKNCWFKHENEKIIKEHDEKYEEMKENNEVLERLFGMIEKMTERIVTMEENILTNSTKD